ncbi:MAG: hypothetical protein E6I96_09015 [Chloroflexi bacterium]|nr:MAG: hypothetical protein E6I96_09015 [Chloroflexota bacterium]
MVLATIAAAAPSPAWASSTATVRHTVKHKPFRVARLQPSASSTPRVAGRAASAATPVGGAWSPLGPRPINNLDTFGPTSGRVTALAANASGESIYLGTADGGVWKTQDSGAHWSAMTDNQPSWIASPARGC